VNSKAVILLIFLLSLCPLFSIEKEISVFNTRAFNSLDLDPSNALYFADKSIYLNNNSDKKEYLYSLYIKARALDILNEKFLLIDTVKEGFNIIKEGNIKLDNNLFILFIAETFLKYEMYEELDTLLTIEELVASLDDREVVYFSILRFKLNFELGIEIDLNKFEQILNLSKSLENDEILAMVYNFFGEYYKDIDLQKSLSYFLKSSEFEMSPYGVQSLLALGEITNSTNYLKEAYLVSKFINKDPLEIEVLKSLCQKYKKVGDYKNLSIVQEDLIALQEKYSNFILLQNKKIQRLGFNQEVLLDKLEKSKTKESFLQLILISMAVAIFFFIIVLSVQSYRLRGFNI